MFKTSYITKVMNSYNTFPEELYLCTLEWKSHKLVTGNKS